MKDPLAFTPDEMRRFGYRVVDMLVDHFAHLPERSVGRAPSPDEFASTLSGALPERGAPFEEVLRDLQSHVFDAILHLDHPRFFGFIPGPSCYTGVMGEALAAGYNVFAGTWLEAAGAAAVERITVDWMCRLCSLPETAGGLFVSGGSMANLAALALAREIKAGHPFGDACVYFSDQTHSSVDRALRVLGFAPEQYTHVRSDDRGRIDVDALQQSITNDRGNGMRPICVVANTGTTNTGAIDNLPALGDLCRDENLWLHADGAYGAAAILTQKGKALLRGLDRVDSLTLDPHKWLFQPYECGLLLVRNATHLHDAFQVLPDYLKDAEAQGAEINYSDYGIQLTRSFRALKLWMTFKIHGLEAIHDAVERGIYLAEYAEKLLREMNDWKVVTPAQIGIVTFRYEPADRDTDEHERINRALPGAAIEDGFAFSSSTIVNGRTVLRLCTINPGTTETDIERTLDKLNELATNLT